MMQGAVQFGRAPLRGTAVVNQTPDTPGFGPDGLPSSSLWPVVGRHTLLAICVASLKLWALPLTNLGHH